MGRAERHRYRVPRLVAAALALAAIAAGCGGTGGAGSGATGIVPSSVPIYISVDTNPGSDQWKTVERLADAFPDKAKAVRSLKDGFRSESNLDWERDVKPALGDEIDIAVFNLSANHADVVALMQPRDEAKFKAGTKKANAKDPSNPLVYDKFNDWYVMADKRATIDKFEQLSSAGGTMLADEDAYAHAMDKLGSDAIARAFVDGSQVMSLIRSQAGPGERPLLKQAGTLDWVGARLGAKDDGVGFDAVVHGTPGKIFKSGFTGGSSFKPSLTQTVPADALAYWTFHGTKDMFSALQQNPLFKSQELGPFGEVLRQLGTLLQGENALYVRKAHPDNIPEVTLVAKPGDGVDGAKVLDRVFNRFRGDIGAAPKRTSIAGTDARTLDFGPFALRYANVGGKLVVTDLPQGIRGVKTPGKPLSKSGEFDAAKSSAGMPDKTYGFLYVDIHSTVPAVEDLSNAPIPDEIERNLRPLRSAVEYAVSRSHEVKVSLFLRIK